jgi:Ca2+-binding RTX toxin-like protein
MAILSNEPFITIHDQNKPQDSIEIGANFPGATADVSIDPVRFGVPDTNGAVGPDHFVELLNGVYSVYDKSGVLLEQSSLDAFWTAAGVQVEFSFDPRVLYDPESDRWFAASVDNLSRGGPPQLNDFLVAVSYTSDPTDGWQAVKIDSDPNDDHRADFPMLGINSDGVFLSANMFPVTAASVVTTFVAIPKDDLLQAAPSIANVTLFDDLDGTDTGFSVQPSVAYGTSGSELFLSAFNTSLGFLKISSIDGPITNPQLNVLDRLVDVPPASPPPPAIQEGTSETIDLSFSGSRFSSSVVLQDGKLFGVQSIDDGGHAALRWFMIDDPISAPTLLDSGIIHPDNLDVYFGSIAVNPLGQAVIGFTGSGPDDFPSAYAVAGTLVGDDLEFGDPILLQAGTGPFTAFGGRWGDYSATTFDPDNPTHFWTIQEWSAGSLGGREDLWATQVTEIIFDFAIADDNDNVVDGTAGNDLLPGLGGDDIIRGFAGDDTLQGGDGNDTLLAGLGNDTLQGGDGNDFLSGGQGDDNINTGQGDDVVLGGAGNDQIGGMAGRDIVRAGAGDDLIAWNDPTGDVVFGGRGNDTILGGNVAADEIHGGAGDDLIQAFATSPEAATASDRLFGDAGDDGVTGGNAADFIEGGRGDDILTGNAGADVFSFRADQTGDDTITDFDPSEDVVELVGFGASFDPLAALSAATGGTELDLGGGNSVLLLDRTVAEFGADDFLIV